MRRYRGIDISRIPEDLRDQIAEVDRYLKAVSELVTSNLIQKSDGSPESWQQPYANPGPRYALKRTFTPPTTVTLNNGTSSSTVSDMQALNDGNQYDLEEVSGAPGMDLRINFTGITSVEGLVMRSYYEGSSSHYVTADIYNYHTQAFDELIRMQHADAHNYRTILMPDGSKYFTDTGNAVIRLYHPTAGVPSHDSYIDYVALIGVVS